MSNIIEKQKGHLTRPIRLDYKLKYKKLYRSTSRKPAESG